MVPGSCSPMHLNALDAAVTAAYGGFANAPTTMALTGWGLASVGR